MIENRRCHTWFIPQWQQSDVWSSDGGVRRVFHTEQSGDGIGLQFLAAGRGFGYFLKLALLKMILEKTQKTLNLLKIHSFKHKKH